MGRDPWSHSMMHDELTTRQHTISLRPASQPVKHICSALGRSAAWFHKW